MFATNYVVYLIEDDVHLREALIALFNSIKLKVIDYSDPLLFLKQFEKGLVETSCIVLDIRLPIMSGLELFKLLKNKECHQPVILITGHGDINMAVQAIKEGAFDFLPKPFNNQNLIESVQRAFVHVTEIQDDLHFKHKLDTLNPREKQILAFLLNGKKNKEISYDLDLSISSVELGRANLMKKLGIKNIMELVKYHSIIDTELKKDKTI